MAEQITFYPAKLNIVELHGLVWLASCPAMRRVPKLAGWLLQVIKREHIRRRDIDAGTRIRGPFLAVIRFRRFTTDELHDTCAVAMAIARAYSSTGPGQLMQRVADALGGELGRRLFPLTTPENKEE